MYARFNEAEAIKPRNRVAITDPPSLSGRRFNEAEAIKPRNPNVFRCAGADGPRFNEAEAIKPRNPEPFELGRRTEIGLQ